MSCLSVNFTRVGSGLRVHMGVHEGFRVNLSVLCTPSELPMLLVEPQEIKLNAYGDGVNVVVTSNANWNVYAAEGV